MIARTIRVSLGLALMLGGFYFALISGSPDLCRTHSGTYCVDLPQLAPILSGVGVAITTAGFVIIDDTVWKRRA